ncbi:MAG: 4Fe-4S binding protein [Firmicutes bacterium]|nr:4Fe-4S binding protein [Bacillota bacterium]
MVREKVLADDLCTRVYPAEAISLQGKKEAATIDSGSCLLCLACLERCPRLAISYRASEERVVANRLSFPSIPPSFW